VTVNCIVHFLQCVIIFFSLGNYRHLLVHQTLGHSHQIGGGDFGADEPWIVGLGNPFLAFGQVAEAAFLQDELCFVPLDQDGDDDDEHFHLGGTG